MNETEPQNDMKAKGQDFLEKAKAGTLDEASLKWGLSAGAIIAAVSLPFAYVSASNVLFSFKMTGLDLLRSGNSLEGLAIPLTAIYGLYLHFGEPNLKLFSMETAGRPKLIYMIGMIMGALGTLGCIRIISWAGVTIGNVLGLVGLGLLTFVFFKLWQMSPAAPTQPPVMTPPSGGPPPMPPQ
jgi:hypothetical protein